MIKVNLLIKIGRIITPLVCGIITSLMIDMDIGLINQPPLSPPAFLFPIVWTILYILIGVSYYLYRKNNKNSKTIIIYYLQLILNIIWSFIFFTFKNYLLASIWIIILLVTIIILIFRYLKENDLSAYLIIPYMVWVFIATYLSIGVYILN